MFDNVQQKSQPLNVSGPQAAEKVDGEIKTMPMEYYLGEKTGTAATFAPTNAAKPAAIATARKSKLPWILGGAAVLVVIGLSGYLLYLSYQPAPTVKAPTQQPAAKPVVQQQPTIALDSAPATPAAVVTATPSTQVTTPEPATKSLVFDPAKLSRFSLDLLATADNDRDGLTDAEEAVLGTNPQLLDTDKDGYLDGEEVKNFFSPLEIGTVRLWETDAVKEFANTTYGYKFLYPASFIATPMDVADPKEVMVASAQNEFFYILMDTKSPEQSLVDWYLAKASMAAADSLITYQTFNKLEVLESPDGFTAYLAKGDTVYILNYNIGLAEQAKFPDLFAMLVNSFQFAD